MSGGVIAFALIYCFVLTNDEFIFAVITWPRYGQCIGLTLISLVLAYGVLRAVSPLPNFFQRILSFKYLRTIEQI